MWYLRPHAASSDSARHMCHFFRSLPPDLNKVFGQIEAHVQSTPQIFLRKLLHSLLHCITCTWLVFSECDPEMQILMEWCAADMFLHSFEFSVSNICAQLAQACGVKFHSWPIVVSHNVSKLILLRKRDCWERGTH